MAIDVLERERQRLPFKWKLFGAGRSLKALPGLLEPGETLLTVCPGSETVADPSAATNYMLAATDRRLIVVRLSALGGAKSHRSIPYGELVSFEVEREKRKTRLRFAAPDFQLALSHLPPDQLADLERAVSERRQG